MLIDRRFPETKAAYVGAENREIGRLATEHLIAQGANASGTSPVRGSPPAWAGWKAIAMRSPRTASSFATNSWSTAPATKVTPPPANCWRSQPRADGIVCFNDPYAVSAMKAVIEAGLRIPEDIKVIGAGNVHYSDLLRVPLSTIDQKSTQTGEQAAEILLGMIAPAPRSKSRAQNRQIKPELVVRESTRA